MHYLFKAAASYIIYQRIPFKLGGYLIQPVDFMNPIRYWLS